MRSAVLFSRRDGAIFLHAPDLGLVARLAGDERRRSPRVAALLRCEGDLRRSIRLAQQAVSLAFLAELAACDALQGPIGFESPARARAAASGAGGREEPAEL